ncbi:hypothetical protein SAMN05421881_10958 [Nitrosomonas halophila]|uniref:Uncharacterized protein n=1 Tax=Nitrosomonas halophila TaxID=44576 RepID=A0A1H3PCS2_9PROT|nr:hypothetical protein SAMN05421881_10958 [Nitrosomonas halophila]
MFMLDRLGAQQKSRLVTTHKYQEHQSRRTGKWTKAYQCFIWDFKPAQSSLDALDNTTTMFHDTLMVAPFRPDVVARHARRYSQNFSRSAEMRANDAAVTPPEDCAVLQGCRGAVSPRSAGRTFRY